VEDVDATIRNLEHTCPDDLDFLLVGPQGENTLLLSHAGDCGVNPPNSLTITLDDEAAEPYPECTDVSGTFKPTADACFEDDEPFPPPAPPEPYPVSLSVFDGTDPNGDWHLYVYDQYAGDVGSMVNGWSLTITAPTPQAETQKANRLLTLDVNKNKVRRKKKVTLSGRLSTAARQGPCESAQTVELQRKRSGRPTFTTFAQVQTDAGGGFSLTKELKKRKILEFRAQVVETAACTAALSNSELVKVKKRK
jgi:hypothetical protein